MANVMLEILDDFFDMSPDVQAFNMFKFRVLTSDFRF